MIESCYTVDQPTSMLNEIIGLLIIRIVDLKNRFFLNPYAFPSFQ